MKLAGGGGSSAISLFEISKSPISLSPSICERIGGQREKARVERAKSGAAQRGGDGGLLGLCVCVCQLG